MTGFFKLSNVLACLVLCVSILLHAEPASAQDECAANAQSLQHEFESGASWQLCWQIHGQLGLVLSEIAYAAPAQALRQVLEEIHSAGLLMHYDDSATATDVVTESGLGSGNAINLNAHHCAHEILSDTEGRLLLCKQVRYRNTLTRYASADILPRHSVVLSAHARYGTLVWSIEFELTEDGMIMPAAILSGRIQRFSNDPAVGTALDSSGQFASSASLLSIWRMDFNIDGSAENDVVDEIQFDSDQSLGVRRRIAVRAINFESRRQVDASRFRGWRVSDRDLSASVDGSNFTRAGYYLDPQSAGYVYSSNRFNWARHQFFVTEHSHCERTAINNRRNFPDCGNTLDDYIAGSNTPVSNPTTWYAQSARFRASSGDWPVIKSRRNSFRLIPFDWSAASPFPNSYNVSK